MKAPRYLFSAVLVLCSLSAPAFAEDVGYEVEVIIFEDTTGVYDHVEKWSAVEDHLEQQDQVQATEQRSAADNKASAELAKIQPLSAKQFRLNSEANRLAQHPDYHVLLHAAWKQRGLDRDLAFPVHIDSNLGISTQAPASDATSQPSDAHATHIAGDITLVMSRYLHINADLIYQKPITEVIDQPVDLQPAASRSPFDKPTSGPTTVIRYEDFPVKFERRMRSREIHYLDHPLVGMIVLATPFKIESESKGAKPGGYQTL